MRCSAYKGCQQNSGLGLVFFLSAVFVFFPFPVFPVLEFVPPGAASLSVPGRVPVTSSYSSITES